MKGEVGQSKMHHGHLPTGVHRCVHRCTSNLHSLRLGDIPKWSGCVTGHCAEPDSHPDV